MLRVGFDMDGVLADFASAFRDAEVRLYGPDSGLVAGNPEAEEEAQHNVDGDGDDNKPSELSPKQLRHRRDRVWRAIQSTANFWETLEPTEKGAVARIHEMMLRHRWEVFFVTQRPATEGDTVQRQTQRWLVKQGFDLPSVLVLGGSRGAAAGALRLNYHVDDSPQNCIDVISDSRAKAILVLADQDETTRVQARKLGIGTAPSIDACLDILEQASRARSQPGFLQRIAAAVGWK